MSNEENSESYLRQIWKKIKKILVNSERLQSTEYLMTNGNESNYLVPIKKPRLDIRAHSIHDSFDQSGFMEVMRKLLTCSVCLEVRKQANQCQNGHLICINCTLCLQQSSSAKEINCPVCRVPLAGYYQRSLLAEQLVCELPTKCRFCSATMSIRQLQQHESEICQARVISCRYALFGCFWKGIEKQRKCHESICNVGLSSVALACETVQLNLKKQFNYYEKRNSQWQNTVNKLRERTNGLKIFIKHLVVTKYKEQINIKSSFKTTKLEIFKNHFQLKFTILRDKRSQTSTMLYKLKYTSTQSILVNFFLYSIRYDEETIEVDDNLHSHTFTEDEQNAGSYSIHFSRSNLDEIKFLFDILASKDSLYLEIVLMMETNEFLDYVAPNISQLDSTDSISQALTNSRTGSNNAGNLVVALISSNSLGSPSNEVIDEETEEVFDNEEEEQEHVTYEHEIEDLNEEENANENFESERQDENEPSIVDGEKENF